MRRGPPLRRAENPQRTKQFPYRTDGPAFAGKLWRAGRRSVPTPAKRGTRNAERGAEFGGMDGWRTAWQSVPTSTTRCHANALADNYGAGWPGVSGYRAACRYRPFKFEHDLVFGTALALGRKSNWTPSKPRRLTQRFHILRFEDLKETRRSNTIQSGTGSAEFFYRSKQRKLRTRDAKRRFGYGAAAGGPISHLRFEDLKEGGRGARNFRVRCWKGSGDLEPMTENPRFTESCRSTVRGGCGRIACRW